MQFLIELGFPPKIELYFPVKQWNIKNLHKINWFFMGNKSSTRSRYGQYSSAFGNANDRESHSSNGSSATSPYPENNVEHKIRRNLPTKYRKIDDNYHSLEQVTVALSRAGLKSSNLIVGIDFTKSNEWTGATSFNNRSLHCIGDEPNPYEQAISIIGRTLSSFDKDNLIPCFGFGDERTYDNEVFSFYPEDKVCHGFEEVLSRYRELVPQLNLSGPTSFAPIIETAVGIVDNSGGQYHVLLIIADGQVTRSVDTPNGHFSCQEQATVDALVKASNYPLSIVLVGVGDGPWDMMHDFDDNIPQRAFDNFQFVNFTEIMSTNVPPSKKEADFALAALMEIPSQYKATKKLKVLRRKRGIQSRIAIPPPITSNNSDPSGSYSRSNSSHYDPRVYNNFPATQQDTNDRSNQCPVCFVVTKNLAFGCGHQTCIDCGRHLKLCPICRSKISTKIKLY